MTGALLLTAALMGVAATPHCATMCAGLCSGSASGSCGTVKSTAPVFLGRLSGYALTGALAAGIHQSLRWLGDAVDWARPFWSIAQGLLLVLGLLLLVRGSFPPAWVSRVEALQQSWRGWRGQVAQASPSPVRRFAVALLWPLLPCGVLHAALLVAALASTPAEGALVMTVFGLASMPGLLWGARVWRVIRARWSALRPPAPARVLPGESAAQPGWTPVQWVRTAVAPASTVVSDTMPVRLAGAALAVSVAWGLVGARWFPAISAWCG